MARQRQLSKLEAQGLIQGFEYTHESAWNTLKDFLEERNGADIDLTLCGADLTLDTLYRIADDLDDLFLPHTFDVSIFHHISDPDVIGHIRRFGVTLYEKEPRMTDSTLHGLRRDG